MSRTAKLSVCSCTCVKACSKLTPNPTNVASKMDGSDSNRTRYIASEDKETMMEEFTLLF